MKKFRIATVTCLMLCAIMLFTACSSFGGIKSAFVEAGYTYREDKVSSYEKYVDEEKAYNITMHAFVKTTSTLFGDVESTAIVLEFGATEEMYEYLSENQEFNNLVGEISQSKLVNGNCVLIPVSILYANEMIEIFQSTNDANE